MRTIFSYRLRRLRGQILGWGIALALLGVILVLFYGSIADQQEQFEDLLDAYPKEMLAFFGDFDSFTKPSGYLGIEFFSYMPLIVGVFSILIGSGLFVSDEESGRLDLIMAHPVSRTAFFWGRVLAFIVATIGILFITWLGIALPSRGTELSVVSPVTLLWPFLALFGELVCFSGLAVMLSLLLPSRRAAAMVSGLVLVASFFLVGLSAINADLELIAKLTPLYYYQGGEAIDDFNLVWVLGLLAFGVLFTLLGWWLFERRDIRVGGEGAWQRPSRSYLSRVLRRKEKAAPEVPVAKGAAASR